MNYDFILRKHKAGVRGVIYLRIRHEGKDCCRSTRYECFEDAWDESTQRFKNSPLNVLLNQLQNDIENAFITLKMRKEVVTARRLMEAVLKP